MSKLPPLLKFDSLYLQQIGLSDKQIEVICETIKEHRDWDCRIDLKFDKLISRHET